MLAGFGSRTSDPAVEAHPSPSRAAGSPLSFDAELIREFAEMIGVEHDIKFVLSDGQLCDCHPRANGTHSFDGRKHVIKIKVADRDPRDVNRTTVHELGHAIGLDEAGAQAFAQRFASWKLVRRS
jgi:hypothetical protein